MKRVIFVLALLFSFSAQASIYSSDEVEEVIVVGAKVYNGYSDPVYDEHALEAVMPTKRFAPGGKGGFIGANINGMDVKHTSVWKNGVPANDPSSGWYDFGTDLVAQQYVKYISGPNSVRYGSGSIAGAIIIEDTFENNTILKGGLNTDEYYVKTGMSNISVAHFKGHNGSVRSDNEEIDWYENTTVKVGGDVGQWRFRAEAVDYEYDYDQCYMPDWSVSNDCQQDGKKYNASIRSNFMTLGYYKNEQEHNSGYLVDAERIYVDAIVMDYQGHQLGLNAEQEKYNEMDRKNGAIYYRVTQEQWGLGIRAEEDGPIVGRIGVDIGPVKWSLGNSYRRPTLYEAIGDAWVSANPDLDAEEGIGTELAFFNFSIYYYDFSEGIEFDNGAYQYVNSGEFVSQGVKYNNTILTENGNWILHFEYTDSEKLRVPEFMTKLGYEWSDQLSNGMPWDASIMYVGEFNKGLEYNGEPIDDVSSANLRWGVYPNPDMHIVLAVEDIFDNKFEILPGYPAGGREISLSIRLSY